MPYRDEPHALRERADLFEAERDRALADLARARAALASLLAELAGRTAKDDVPWRSIPGGDPIRVRFVNHRDRKIELRWIGYDGREHADRTLIAGGEREIETHVGALWRFVDPDGGEILRQAYVRFEESPRLVLDAE